MGSANVGAVMVHWRHLPDTSFRVLAYMATVALDRPNGRTPERCYFGGWESIATGLGRQPGGASHTAVKRAVRELVAAGAITPTRHAAPGRRQVYRLNLDCGS